MRNSKTVLFDSNPGRNAQTVGIARELGTDIDLIHEPSVGVVGNKGDSQCYLGVQRKVEVIHERLREKIGHGDDQMRMRLVQPEYTVATSDGMRNGTREMRYSLIGREVTHDTMCEHLSASGLEGTIAVVACDKPPVGTLAAILEHDRPAIIMSDGPIRPGMDSVTNEPIDIITGFQVAGSDDEDLKKRIACEACPGYGSCGGMFTYNTMQTFIAVVGLEPLHMVSPPSDDARRMEQFPGELVTYLNAMIDADLTPRKIVSRDSIRNAMIVAMAVGGSTNVLLHGPEIARAAGYGDFSRDIMSPEEFNHLSKNVVPVLVDARPFGNYSMVDIDEKGGIQVIVKELLDAGLLNGETLTCTGETLAEQVARLNPPAPDGDGHLYRGKPLQADRRLAGAGRQSLAGIQRRAETGRRRRWPGRQCFRRQGAGVRQRGRPLAFAGKPTRGIREPRHDHCALRRAQRRAGHAGNARFHLQDHHAVPGKGHDRRPDDGCPVLRRIGGPGDRPCRPGSRLGRPDCLRGEWR